MKQKLSKLSKKENLGLGYFENIGISEGKKSNQNTLSINNHDLSSSVDVHWRLKHI